MLTKPLPLVRMPRIIPDWNVLRPRDLAMAVRKTGKPRSYRWATPCPKVREPRMNPLFCLWLLDDWTACAIYFRRCGLCAS